MHGAGNDFCLFNGLQQSLPEYGALAQVVCDRHFGVGGDGIMICLPSQSADIRMVYYNSDGSQGEMCGNGIRCFSKFVYESGIVHKTVFSVETLAGIKSIRLTLNDIDIVQKITVGMGKPDFEPDQIPTTLLGTPVVQRLLDVSGQQIELTAMRMAVPHCVIFVEDLGQVDINGLGREIETHPAFPAKVNVNFIQIIDRGHISIKTWERGAGRTLACGTGCSASVVAGRLTGKLDDTVSVQAEGGNVEIYVGEDYEVTMTGEAEFICKGIFSEWINKQIATILTQ